ncbi:gp482 [Bacillus phage G]|uniref:Gp482 n=1 Tax=Bacillus phage G TaxID=2884420 RepID=G3MAM3_9CAUD|nr:gp482 [Bacillus phage G]AEO93740.1 gp482 [Bacillus phage G]
MREDLSVLGKLLTEGVYTYFPNCDSVSLNERRDTYKLDLIMNISESDYLADVLVKGMTYKEFEEKINYMYGINVEVIVMGLAA